MPAQEAGGCPLTKQQKTGGSAGGGGVSARRPGPNRAPSPPAAATQRLPGHHQGPSWPVSALEDLQPDVLYHVLVCLAQQDVAHVKMCSSRLRSNILGACQHWAPKVESWLMSDPSSADLLKQLRGAGSQAAAGQRPPAAVAAAAAAIGGSTGGAPRLGVSARTFAAVAAAAAAQDDGSSAPRQQASQPPAAASAAPAAASPDQLAQRLLGCQQRPTLVVSGCDIPVGGRGTMLAELTTPPGHLPLPSAKRLDWRQVWSCLERAQQGPWQLDVRRLTPAAFPHGVLLTFELLLQQPAPPLEPGGRESQAAGWRDSVCVLSFVLDGKTVEVMVDASGRVSSPQKDWCQGSITLQVGQPKLLALEVSYLFPVPAWYLHPCTLAAPKALGSRSSSSSSCGSGLGCVAPDTAWDSHSSSSGGSSSGSSSGGGGSSASIMSLAHSAALTTAVSSLSLSSGAAAGGSVHGSQASTPPGSSSGGGSDGCAGGRPRLCLDLSHGFGSYVIDPRFIDDAARNARPNGLQRLELAGRVCWRPNKVQSWLGRLLPGIRREPSGSHGPGCRPGVSSGGGGSCSSSSLASSASALGPADCPSSSGGSGSDSLGVPSFSAAPGAGGSGASISSGPPHGSLGGVPGAGSGAMASGHPAACTATSSKGGARPSFAVSVSKAAVWQVPEDPEFRFSEGFMFCAVQHKAAQLLGHYGLLAPLQPSTLGAAQEGAQREAAAAALARAAARS